MRSMPGCFMGSQPGAVGFPSGPGMMSAGGQPWMPGEMFHLPQNLSAMEMMNSELMQKTMMGQGPTGLSDDYIQTPTMPFPAQADKPRVSWIEWFCSLEGHEFLLKVDSSFIKDRANLICLNDKAIGIALDKKRIEECLRLLLSKQQPSEEDLQNEQFLQLNQDTSDLYTVIHARYIRSPEGKYSLLTENRHGCPLPSVLDRSVRVLPPRALRQAESSPRGA